jgi:hypothetical protein
MREGYSMYSPSSNQVSAALRAASESGAPISCVRSRASVCNNQGLSAVGVAVRYQVTPLDVVRNLSLLRATHVTIA